MSFIEIGAFPDQVLVQTEKGWASPDRQGNRWIYKDIEIEYDSLEKKSDVYLEAVSTPVYRVVFRWQGDMGQNVKLLGDHWERGYGDLEWRGIIPERVMPWYFLMYTTEVTHGYGVKTQPGAMCFWQVDQKTITLCMDVRSGGTGVVLNQKKLHVATIVWRKGQQNESSFEAATAFCKVMCDKPLMPKFPVYGGNNWYYAYGSSSHEEIIEDAKLVSSLATSNNNRPFMVIDDGWQICHQPSYNGGPWFSGNYKFPDMRGLAENMKELGTRPGIWYRSLLTYEKMPSGFGLPVERSRIHNNLRKELVMDPSIPEVLEKVKCDIRQLAQWGYELIKHDFSTGDIFGRWGLQMSGQLTNDGWHFNDRSKTSAEVIKDFYGAIREAAQDTLIIGCATLSHFAAGLFEIQRTGDDTSGREWERTRKMGINTLAFRMPQHGTFYACDADCAGITDQIPWYLNEQWLRLLAQSGTPLFVSADPKTMGSEQKKAIKEVFDIASKEIPVAEPLDWMHNTCPAKWRISGQIINFDWTDKGNLDI